MFLRFRKPAKGQLCPCASGLLRKILGSLTETERQTTGVKWHLPPYASSALLCITSEH